MSFLASLRNPFGKSSSATPPANPANPANPAPGNDDGNAGKTIQQTDPLAPFAKMYDTVPNADKAPEFVLPNEALDSAAKANNFAAGFDPAKMQAAMGGDANAMFELNQHMAQQAYKTALAHASALTGKFVDARETFASKGLGARVRGELTASALADTPNYANPVVKKQLIETAQLLQRQHPDATPQEIASMAKTYLTELAQAISGNSSQQANAAPKDTDWESFFDTP